MYLFKFTVTFECESEVKFN